VRDAASRVAKARTLLEGAIQVHARVRDGDLRPVAEAADLLVGALRRGGRVLVFGNGGSAAEAQHFAAELMGRFEVERRAFKRRSSRCCTSCAPWSSRN